MGSGPRSSRPRARPAGSTPTADGPLAPAMVGVMATDRYGTAAEVAAFVSYLAGPEAAYIAGSSLNIDGGFTA
ncbi:SDR family oxidoreductase [Amycolatopsis thermoflava]|uniref:SDR family oxidoreductase n=1 Tax=Amycolatopsis thermoflava TaxID=84480 RepID=UPI0036695EE2